MKKILPLIIPFFNFYTSFAQNNTDSGTYLLHKFEQNIGKEKYIVSRSGNNINYIVDFKYIDRGSPVGLTADLQLTAAFEPVSYRIKGGTSRFSAINDSVVVNDKTAFVKVDDSSFTKMLQPNSFTVAGYSPATAQMLLIQYWKKNNKPSTIQMLPYGSIQIKKDDEDSFSFDKKSLVLDRYVIKGLIWGNELLWTNAKGQLYCLITNDAEGDKAYGHKSFVNEE